MDPLKEAESAITRVEREVERRRPETTVPDEQRSVAQDRLINYRLKLAAIAQGLNPFPATIVHHHTGGEAP